MAPPKLLIVEHDEAVRTRLKFGLHNEFDLCFAGDRPQALAAVQSTRPELILLDLSLPPNPDTPVEGLKALEEILAASPHVKVIILGGSVVHRNTVNSIRLAFDYHEKPLNLATLTAMLRRAAYPYRHAPIDEPKASALEGRLDEILGKTPAMRTILTIIQRVAKTDAPVLIEGESGTGKELIARAIHRQSRRRLAPFTPIDCGAIPETLLESQLFSPDQVGLADANPQLSATPKLVERGTLFLDDISELSLHLQVKLLRFLQERTVQPTGSRERIRVDLRVIAATDQDLKAQIQRARFRQDLYYQLSVVTIQVPPLRERGDDILRLANSFLRRGGQEHRRRRRFSPDSERALTAYSWPGNIRELENKVSRALIMALGRVIEPADLDLESITTSPTAPSWASQPGGLASDRRQSLY
jgi:two-component system NtrC family response regulator